jgi:hypothetical protein
VLHAWPAAARQQSMVQLNQTEGRGLTFAPPSGRLERVSRCTLRSNKPSKSAMRSLQHRGTDAHNS